MALRVPAVRAMRESMANTVASRPAAASETSSSRAMSGSTPDDQVFVGAYHEDGQRRHVDPEREP